MKKEITEKPKRHTIIVYSFDPKTRVVDCTMTAKTSPMTKARAKEVLTKELSSNPNSAGYLK